MFTAVYFKVESVFLRFTCKYQVCVHDSQRIAEVSRRMVMWPNAIVWFFFRFLKNWDWLLVYVQSSIKKESMVLLVLSTQLNCPVMYGWSFFKFVSKNWWASSESCMYLNQFSGMNPNTMPFRSQNSIQFNECR